MNEAEQFAALDQILNLALLINADMTSSLARDNLTESRTHLLWVLRQRGPSTQRDLAEAMKVSARTVTGLVDGLVATGFVTRAAHPTDRRAFLVTVTPHAVAILEQMERDHQEFARILFAGMPQAQFDGFVTGLGEILRRLRPYDVREREEP